MLYKVTISSGNDEVILTVSAKTKSGAIEVACKRIMEEMPRFRLVNAEFEVEPVLRLKRHNNGH